MQDYSPAELQVAKLADFAEGHRQQQYYLMPPETCDLCGCALEDCSLFIDGSLQGEMIFANMCADCFLAKGSGIGWGTGQLYHQETDDSWLMVGGFPPEDDNE